MTLLQRAWHERPEQPNPRKRRSSPQTLLLRRIMVKSWMMMTMRVGCQPNFNANVMSIIRLGCQAAGTDAMWRIILCLMKRQQKDVDPSSQGTKGQTDKREGNMDRCISTMQIGLPIKQIKSCFRVLNEIKRCWQPIFAKHEGGAATVGVVSSRHVCQSDSRFGRCRSQFAFGPCQSQSLSQHEESPPSCRHCLVCPRDHHSKDLPS
mmetsp:Transcript_11840/g.27423  ORF Transcript_11840/g.27423 Transcript_11840/m.27423 type:complete len:207 (+) Transcript_11840:263-883(+)